jgi:cytosine/adenosine deaminase-related metal-dependent hydrolase
MTDYNEFYSMICFKTIFFNYIVMTSNIFCRYALLGDQLTLEEDVEIIISDKGKIQEIIINVQKDISLFKYYFDDHLLIPKFINPHTHLGDAVIKDHALNSSLNEAVGPNGIKYNVTSLSREERIDAMRVTLLDMIFEGISTCFDFREGGLEGVRELLIAAKGLPIDVRILGRPESHSNFDVLLNHVDGLGYSTPLSYPLEEIRKQADSALRRDKIIATHIGESNDVIQDCKKKFGKSDLLLALEYLGPRIIVHLNNTDEHELGRIPITTLIVFCPRSNAYFNIPFPPVKYFLEHSLNYLIGIGTDNVMTTPPSVLDELRWLVLRLREQGFNLSPQQAIKLITVNPSRGLHLLSGILGVDYWADLMVIDLQGRGIKYSLDPITALLYRTVISNDCKLNMFHGEVINPEIK